MTSENFSILSPWISNGDYLREDYSIWITKANAILPNFPEEVLKYFLYRHFDLSDFIYEQSKLEFWEFKKEKVSIFFLNKVCSIMENINEQPFFEYVDNLLIFRNGEDAKKYNNILNYIIDNNTYPKFIIIKEDTTCKGGYIVVDGHHRLGILKALYLSKNSKIKDMQHQIYIIKDNNEKK